MIAKSASAIAQHAELRQFSESNFRINKSQQKSLENRFIVESAFARKATILNSREEFKGNTLAEQLYECMFLLDSGRYAQDPQGTESTVREILERCGAEVVVTSPWQEGKLAYEIEGHRKGLHYLTYFKMDGSQVESFNRICKLNEVVVRQLLLEHEETLFTLLTQQFDEEPHTLTSVAEGEEVPAPEPVAAGETSEAGGEE